MNEALSYVIRVAYVIKIHRIFPIENKNCELDLSSKLVWNCGRAVDKVVEKVLPKKTRLPNQELCAGMHMA